MGSIYHKSYIIIMLINVNREHVSYIMLIIIDLNVEAYMSIIINLDRKHMSIIINLNGEHVQPCLRMFHCSADEPLGLYDDCNDDYAHLNQVHSD